MSERVVFAPDEAFDRNRGLIGSDEQARLGKSFVGVAGCGGVGGVHAHTLARLGIGRFRLCDPDTFSLANFNRQIGATVETIGHGKASVTERMIRSINPSARVELLGDGIGPENVSSFLEGLDLVVDGIDFFALPARRVLYRAAWERGVPVVIAAPLGFSGTLQVFARGGMSFDEYFDLRDGQPAFDQYVNFLVGLAPRALHAPYTDISTADPATGRGPSSIVGSQMAACLVGAEAVRILLGRGASQLAPAYVQMDVYRWRCRTGRLRGGMAGLPQRLRRFLVKRYLAKIGLAQALAELEPA